MRRRFNGFDLIVVALVVVGLLLLARRALHHTVHPAAQHTVVFTIASMPTQNAAAIAERLQAGGVVKVSASGSYVPLGTLRSFSTVPYRQAVPEGGKLVAAVDPLLQTLQLEVVAQADVSHKAVSINGNPFLVGQQTTFQEGGAQFVGVISGETVR